MTILWGKDSQVSCASGNEADWLGAGDCEHRLNESATKQQPHNGSGAVPIKRIGPASKSGLSTDSVAQSEKAGRPVTPRVYSAWIDDFSDDLYQFAEPSYTPRSTFSERVAEIALCGFILLAVVCGLARWF